MSITSLTNPAQATALLQAREKSLINFLGSEENARKFYSAAYQVISSNPKLLQCRPDTLVGAFMEAANAGLYPSKWGQECSIVPYKGVATFVPGYHGMIALAYRVGCRRVWTEIVRQGDFYDETSGTSPAITHRKAPDEKRGAPLKTYACAELETGAVIFQVVTAAEIEKIKAISQNGSGDYSPWNPARDPLLRMWRKTAVRQLWPYLPKKNQWAERADRAFAVGDAAEAGRGYSIVADDKEETVFVTEELAVDTSEEEQNAAGQNEAYMAGADSEQEQQGIAEAEAAAHAAVDPQHGF